MTTHEALVEKVAHYLRFSCEDTSPETMAEEILSLIAKELEEPSEGMIDAGVNPDGMPDVRKRTVGDRLRAEWRAMLAASALRG